MIARRFAELFAMMMIGEGVIGMIKPRKHLLLWEVGPQPLRDFVDRCADRPDLMRWIFAAQAGLGVWMAWRQLPEEQEEPNRFWSPQQAKRLLSRAR